MTMEITQGMIQALSDESMASIKGLIATEEALRAEKRKHEAIARIKALACANGFSVTISGKRGRPPKAKTDAASVKRAG